MVLYLSTLIKRFDKETGLWIISSVDDSIDNTKPLPCQPNESFEEFIKRARKEFFEGKRNSKKSVRKGHCWWDSCEPGSVRKGFVRW